jgi:hypothetical protein
MFKCQSLMSSLSPKLVLKVRQQDDASCCWVCHGRFHGILPKEYSETFYELPWGLYKDMPTNTWGQSDIVSHQTNILNKAYLCKWTFYHTSLILTSKGKMGASGSPSNTNAAHFVNITAVGNLKK